jgi:hypothetical protein
MGTSFVSLIPSFVIGYFKLVNSLLLVILEGEVRKMGKSGTSEWKIDAQDLNIYLIYKA